MDNLNNYFRLYVCLSMCISVCLSVRSYVIPKNTLEGFIKRIQTFSLSLFERVILSCRALARDSSGNRLYCSRGRLKFN